MHATVHILLAQRTTSSNQATNSSNISWWSREVFFFGSRDEFFFLGRWVGCSYLGFVFLSKSYSSWELFVRTFKDKCTRGFHSRTPVYRHTCTSEAKTRSQMISQGTALLLSLGDVWFETVASTLAFFSSPWQRLRRIVDLKLAQRLGIFSLCQWRHAQRGFSIFVNYCVLLGNTTLINKD